MYLKNAESNCFIKQPGEYMHFKTLFSNIFKVKTDRQNSNLDTKIKAIGECLPKFRILFLIEKNNCCQKQANILS